MIILHAITKDGPLAEINIETGKLVGGDFVWEGDTPHPAEALKDVYAAYSPSTIQIISQPKHGQTLYYSKNKRYSYLIFSLCASATALTMYC